MIIFLIISIISSTYACENLLFITNLIKSKEKNALTDKTIATYSCFTKNDKTHL